MYVVGAGLNNPPVKLAGTPWPAPAGTPEGVK